MAIPTPSKKEILSLMDSRCSACLSAIYTNHAPGCPLIDSREMRAYEIRQGDFPFVKPTDCVVDRPAAPKPESPTTPLILTMDAPAGRSGRSRHCRIFTQS